MPSVFVLFHTRESQIYGCDVKLIGVYSSRENAAEAVNRLKVQPGFIDYPEGFTVDEYQLDHDHWSEGFVTEV
jgi:hypothetical protein